MRETFFQICIIFSILLIVFTLSINFVNALDVYGGSPVEQSVTYETGDTSDDIFAKISGLEGGAQYIWATVLSVTGIVSIAVAILMHSAVPVGVWIFSSVFWASYLRTISIINIDNVFTASPMAQFLVIITVGLIFVWLGALAGMFGGSG